MTTVFPESALEEAERAAKLPLSMESREDLTNVIAQSDAGILEIGSRIDEPHGMADIRLRVRVNAVNFGLGDSVLGALATIDTPYVALLNSDDLFHPDRLARERGLRCAVIRA